MGRPARSAVQRQRWPNADGTMPPDAGRTSSSGFIGLEKAGSAIRKMLGRPNRNMRHNQLILINVLLTLANCWRSLRFVQF